jgi:hypothetical protein
MKKWENPEIVMLDFKATASGGKNRDHVDHTWTDYDEQGNPTDHTNYRS